MLSIQTATIASRVRPSASRTTHGGLHGLSSALRRLQQPGSGGYRTISEMTVSSSANTIPTIKTAFFQTDTGRLGAPEKEENWEGRSSRIGFSAHQPVF